MKFLKATLSAVILFLTFNVHSASIVDTGPGPDPFPGYAWGFGGNDKFSGQFTLTENTSISSITGWIGVDGYGSGFDFNILVYNEINGLPGEALFSQSVYVPPPQNVTPQNSYGFDWYGLSGLDWNLTAGNYWVSFEGIYELQPGSVMPGPSQNPLTHYATNNVITNNVWKLADYLDLGVRIEGAPSSVPIPAAIWLFSSGVIGLFGIAIRKTRANTCE